MAAPDIKRLCGRISDRHPDPGVDAGRGLLTGCNRGWRTIAQHSDPFGFNSKQELDRSQKFSQQGGGFSRPAFTDKVVRPVRSRMQFCRKFLVGRRKRLPHLSRRQGEAGNRPDRIQLRLTVHEVLEIR